MKKRKIVTIIIILAVAIAVGIGSVVAYNAVTTNRTGLVLDLDFGNNDGASAPTVYDTSGNGYNALSVAPSQAPIPYDDYCDFVWGDFIRVSHELFNTAETSIAFKFSPDFEAGDNDEHPLFTGTGYYINKTSSNALYVAFGSSGIHNVSLANYQAYWNVGEENVLVITGTTGNNDLWLNGVKIDETTTAWTQSNPAQIQIGISLTGTKFFDGKMYYMKVWNRLLTDNEVATLSADRTTHVSAPPASGLIGHWNMDSNDISGTTVYDKSGNGNNGTKAGASGTNNTPQSTSGKIKEALNFDGTDDYITKNPADIQHTLSAFTYSAWIKPNTLSDLDTQFRLDIGNVIYVRYNGRISMGFNNGSYYLAQTSAGNYSTGEWLLYTVTWDKSLNSGIPRLYKNGVEQTPETSTAFTSDIIYGGVSRIFIGSWDSGNYFVDGDIDEVRIYNRALPIEEITALYDATKMNYISTVDESDTTLNLDFGNNDGTSVIYDTSGTGANATTAGAPTLTDDYVDLNGTTQNASTTGTGIFNTAQTSFAIKFSPDFDWDSGTDPIFFDSTNANRYILFKIPENNNLYIWYNGTQIYTFTAAEYAP